MAAPSDEISEISWEGPFDWSKRKTAPRKGHMIYAIFGNHCVYGPNVLLYIGRSERADGERLDEHDRWLQDEENVSFRMGSIKEFESWKSRKSAGSLTAKRSKLIKAIEALLIYAHQPAYNSRGFQEPSEFYGIRIFNSGKSGNLLPELSYRYYMDPKIACHE